MSEQRYEYKAVKLKAAPLEQTAETLNEYARDGWQVKHPIYIMQAWQAVLLERPVE